MTDERFTQLLDGKLFHPEILPAVARLVKALRYVVQATGEAGDQALEDYCREVETGNHRD